MVGVGKNYLALITAAARDSSLSEKKIKVNLSKCLVDQIRKVVTELPTLTHYA